MGEHILHASPGGSRPHLGRRLFFRHAATAVGGYFLWPAGGTRRLARAGVSPMNTARYCIFVLMAGAPSHIDTFDLKEGTWTPREFQPTSFGDLRFPQGLLPKLAAQIDSIALLRSMRAWALVHSLSQTWIQIGRNPTSGKAKIAPHIGSVVALELSPLNADRTLPPFASLNASGGPGPGYFPPQYAPFYVSPSGGGLANTSHRDGDTRFATRYRLLHELDASLRARPELGAPFEEMDAFSEGARKLMYNPAVDRIFVFDAAERARYGNSSFGNACITARNLLRARLGTRFIQLTVGGWDNHASIYQTALNAANAGSLARQFDAGLGTLIADLKADGLLDETLIVAVGEFGRTVGALNVQAGRDHFLTQAALLAGARIRGGRALGATDAMGDRVLEPGWARGREVRAEDLEATIYSALGIDWTTTRRDDPLGRGFEYVPFADRDEYGPVHELWG